MSTSSLKSEACGTGQLIDLQGMCLPELVARRAAETPEALAVTAGAQILSYGELDNRADRLACYLRSLGVGTDVVVGLCLPRCLDMVVGALGILKAGGAYLPMDPAWPPDRLAFVLEDAESPVLITDVTLARQIPRSRRVIVDLVAPEITGQPEGLPLSKIKHDDLAYVIYTSCIAVLGAANHDPERFRDSDQLDITRQDNRHLAFGWAAHFCFGAPLARLEGQIALFTILRRRENLTLDSGALVWRTNMGFRGLETLPVTFDPA